MGAPKSLWQHRHRCCRRLVVSGLLELLTLALVAGDLRADTAPPGNADQPADGLFITVRNPIDTTVVNRVKAATNRFLDRREHRGLRIIYDFNPDGYSSSTADYGTCRDLAVFLLDLQDVSTVAFVRNEVSGHTILPVLACQEIVMSKKAKLGEALRGQTKPIEPDQLLFYKTVAERRKRSPAVVMRMVDRNQVLPAGQPEFTEWLDAPHAEKVGLCDLTLETRKEVKDAYRLPTSSLREDPLQGRSPDAWRIVLSGEITEAMRETIERRVSRAVSRGGNVIILQLACHGEDTETARALADFLRTRKDDKGEESVMTIAYVTPEAGASATFLALGCTEIVMDKDAHMGGFDAVLRNRSRYAEAIGRSLADLAEQQGYPGILARGMLEADLVIRCVWEQKGKVRETRFVDEQEFQADQSGEHRLQGGEVIKPRGMLLELDAHRARELDIARDVYDGKPSEATAWFRERYGLDQIKDAGPDFLDGLAEFLSKPGVSMILIMVGIVGLILELKIPGVGLPGVISAVCFILYFWAHHGGQLTMLAILLFVLGLVLIAIEIFVVPGLGIVGISGILLMLAGLALVTLVKKPETTQEWMEFGTTMGTMGLSLGGAVIVAFIIAYYLPHIPYANRMVLVPPGEEGDLLEGESSNTQPFARLLGAIGEAATALRPAGKARFGEDYVDVVAEGSYVMAGARVQIIEVEGNRVVVKEV
jgi:membrane-bound ClpP family serine protease